MQIAPDRYAAMAEIDHLIGNEEKLKAESFLALGGGAAPRVAVADIMGVKETAGHLITGYAERTRAFVERISDMSSERLVSSSTITVPGWRLSI